MSFSLLHRIYKWYKLPIIERLKKGRKEIPLVELDQSHLENTKVLANRNVLLEYLPRNGTVAEIGVDQGKFSSQILSVNQPEKLFLIDSWANKRFNTVKKKAVATRFKTEIASQKVKILQGDSVKLADTFGNEYFDWIYIDTDHSFATTFSELTAYSPKIKKSGFIAGHDFTSGSFHDLVQFGVIEGVKKFCIENNWELAYLTLDPNNFFSFAIKRKD